MVLFVKMEEIKEEQVDKEFPFGYVKFDVFIDYPSRQSNVQVWCSVKCV